MTVLTPADIRHLLEEHSIAPSRALGQNFLADPNTARRIARLAEIAPGDRVLEIGPGLGSLTLALADAGASVHALELDEHVLAALVSVVADRDGVTVEHGDALTYDYAEHLSGEGWICVSNLPYNIATPVVVRLLEAAPNVSRLLVMVQREVGERLAAPPGSRAYGAVSVKVAYYAEARLAGTVPASVFMPRPEGRVGARSPRSPWHATRRRAVDRAALRLGAGGFRHPSQDAAASAPLDARRTNQIRPRGCGDRAVSDEVWDREIVPALTDYIRIPNVSPAYDAGWETAGHMDRAVELARAWCAARPIEGLTVEVLALEGRTPLLLCDVSGHRPTPTRPTPSLLYGHLDKQPPDARLARRARAVGAGRSRTAASTAGAAPTTATPASPRSPPSRRSRPAGGSHARCVVLIECSEESGSTDLPAHLDQLGDRLGTPSLVVCLDSGCADLRPSVGHHVAAGQPHRRAPGRRADRGRALGRRPAAWCRRRSGCCAACSTASRIPTPAACCSPSSTPRCPTSGDGSLADTARDLGRRAASPSPTPDRPGRRRTTRPT